MDKLKAVTFSYDDGVEQDKRLIRLLDRYGLKCTFNLNSGRFGSKFNMERTIFGTTSTVSHNNIPMDEIKQVYANHEVAAHTVNHPTLRELPDDQVVSEVLEDAVSLETITGKKVYGLAYPNGYGLPDPIVIEQLTGRKYVPSEKDKLFLEICLLNYESFDLYIRVDYIKKLDIYKLSWFNLEVIDLRKIERYMGSEYINSNTLEYILGILDGKDNNYHEESENNTVILNCYFGDGYHYQFSRFIPKELAFLSDVFSVIFSI